mmetsp:Transcript_2339/g.6131  ORF Transcript_2339/g.6131 Transcript_2339/m.6131 type:complete len:238 (-) Transcript_2339:101-814(-)
MARRWIPFLLAHDYRERGLPGYQVGPVSCLCVVGIVHDFVSKRFVAVDRQFHVGLCYREIFSCGKQLQVVPVHDATPENEFVIVVVLRSYALAGASAVELAVHQNDEVPTQHSLPVRCDVVQCAVEVNPPRLGVFDYAWGLLPWPSSASASVLVVTSRRQAAGAAQTAHAVHAGASSVVHHVRVCLHHLVVVVVCVGLLLLCVFVALFALFVLCVIWLDFCFFFVIDCDCDCDCVEF